jgi:hypothetical protein
MEAVSENKSFNLFIVVFYNNKKIFYDLSIYLDLGKQDKM